MFSVYLSSITSLTNSHTVNIYRDVSSPLLPHCTGTWRERGWYYTKSEREGKKRLAENKRQKSNAPYTSICLLLRVTDVFVFYKLNTLSTHRNPYKHTLHSFCTGLSATSSLPTVLTWQQSEYSFTSRTTRLDSKRKSSDLLLHSLQKSLSFEKLCLHSFIVLSFQPANLQLLSVRTPSDLSFISYTQHESCDRGIFIDVYFTFDCDIIILSPLLFYTQPRREALAIYIQYILRNSAVRHQ